MVIVLSGVSCVFIIRESGRIYCHKVKAHRGLFLTASILGNELSNAEKSLPNDDDCWLPPLMKKSSIPSSTVADAMLSFGVANSAALSPSSSRSRLRKSRSAPELLLLLLRLSS